MVDRNGATLSFSSLLYITSNSGAVSCPIEILMYFTYSKMKIANVHTYYLYKKYTKSFDQICSPMLKICSGQIMYTYLDITVKPGFRGHP